MRITAAALVNVCLRPFGRQVVRIDRLHDLFARLASAQEVIGQQSEEIRRLSRRERSAAIEAALGLHADQLLEVKPTPFVFADARTPEALPGARDLFFEDGQPLPCWREADLELYDDWLTNPKNYPIYFAVLSDLTRGNGRTRLLEIGVRTGYLGVVYAKAAPGPAYYVGVDPNGYVENGLDLASQTFRHLRSSRQFDYTLLEGFSWDKAIQHSLGHCGPYDLIHIDGEHTLEGKLLDLDLARHMLAPGGCVLVDDYDYHAIVADAIQRALTLKWYADITYVASMRGLAILRC